MFRTWIIRWRNTVWVRRLTDIVTSLWLGIIVLPKELFYEILVFWTYYIISIWNKWKCVNANKWLTLISYKCMKKGSSQQQRTQQISTINLISVTLAPNMGLTQVTTLNKKVKAQLLSIIGHMTKFGCELWWIVKLVLKVNCELWWIMKSDRQFCGTVYVISWTVALILSTRKIVNLEHVFVSFQDFVGKTRNFSVWSLARFGREEGYT